jgi:pteridine reductase
MTLDGRVTLVTGGAIRVGRAIVEGLAADGATVAVHHHGSASEARALVAELRSRGRRAEAFRADLTDDAQLATLVADVERTLGPIEVLVNSAAQFTRAPFLDTDASMLDAEWRLNARAPFLLTRAVARGMLERRGGVVVNVLDIGGALVPWRNYSAYCMTKAAMQMLTQVLALELAPHVRVNGVAPGTVLPPGSLGAREREQLRARIPLQRFGTAEDVAATVRFLITGSDFVTGQVIAVDGGRVRGSS